MKRRRLDHVDQPYLAGPGAPVFQERDYSADEIEFMKAMDQYKRDNRRPFPTWSEVLEVLRNLGYRKKPNGNLP